MAPIEWYYAKGDERIGPVSSSEMKRLALEGILKREDLVWRDGMDEWIHAGKVQGLFGEEPVESPAAPPRPKRLSSKPEPVAAAPVAEPGVESPQPPRPADQAVFEDSPASYERSREGTSRHVFDLVLDAARGQLTGQFVDSTVKIFSVCGHYGLYAAMLGLLGFSLLLSIQTDSVVLVSLVAFELVALAVLQYTAHRLVGPLDRLNRTTGGVISSTALPDCCALLAMVGGLTMLLWTAVAAVQTGQFTMILTGLAAFIVCQCLAAAALNPQSLGIDVTPDTRAAEEALGIITFLMKAGLRLVSVVFGTGVIWGTLNILYACYLVFDGDAGPLVANATALYAATIIIICSALPLAACFAFLLKYLVIDVLRALLAIPARTGSEPKPPEELRG